MPPRRKGCSGRRVARLACHELARGRDETRSAPDPHAEPVRMADVRAQRRLLPVQIGARLAAPATALDERELDELELLLPTQAERRPAPREEDCPSSSCRARSSSRRAAAPWGAGDCRPHRTARGSTIVRSRTTSSARSTKKRMSMPQEMRSIMTSPTPPTERRQGVVHRVHQHRAAEADDRRGQLHGATSSLPRSRCRSRAPCTP